MIAMDHKVDESSLKACEGEKKVEPEKLLEECWFFGNLLDRKTSMSMNFSEYPCTTMSENLPGKSYEETYESIKKSSVHECNLMKAPSMPPFMERKDGNSTRKGRDDPAGRRRLNQETSSKNLLREFEDDEEEMEFSMGKLIRQASLKNSDIMPPKKLAAKGIAASGSISRRKPEVESVEVEKIRPQHGMNQLKTQKSLSALDFQELQGFKDLGFDFDYKNSNPASLICEIKPGLQENKREEGNERKLTRTQSWAPPVPTNWGGKRSTEEDIKAQIKFWARAVASNVHQEC